jgi:hypothetical protein
MSVIRMKKLNNQKVKAVVFHDVKKDPRPVKGRELFPEVYCNIFCCAHKKSGKTWTISHIIDECSNSMTQVIAFSSTIHRDPTWRAIKKNCEKMKIPFSGYTSIKENGVDILESILLELGKTSGEEPKVERQTKEMKLIATCVVTDDDPEPNCRQKKPKKEKEIAPEIIFVFDDMSAELQTPIMAKLLKEHRHYKSKTIISSQYWNDIVKEGRLQFDYALLWKGLIRETDKMKEIYSNMAISCTFPMFMNLYELATSEKFSFLYIDKPNGSFRMNFDEGLDPEEDQERIL